MPSRKSISSSEIEMWTHSHIRTTQRVGGGRGGMKKEERERKKTRTSKVSGGKLVYQGDAERREGRERKKG